MPSAVNPQSRMFVLRLWLEPGEQEPGGWRASLLNPVSHQRLYFSDPARLGEFLAGLDLHWPEEPQEFPELEQGGNDAS